MNAPLAELRQVSKTFGGSQRVLQDVNFSCSAGEIHALVGQNGAGKSTLCGVIAGMVRPDSGSLSLGGETIPLRHVSPRQSRVAGVAMVYQHETLVPTFRVAENLAFAEPGWFYREREQAQKIRAHSERFGLDVDPGRRVADMSAGERQRVELLRALARGARLLILDEPTAVLTPSEVEGLTEVLRRLRDEGCGIVLVSHKLSEIQQLADRVTVIRDGSVVATPRADEWGAAAIAQFMLGELPPPETTGRPRRPVGEAVLRLDAVTTTGASRRSALHEVGLELRAGEIVGIAGVEGNGQLELEELFAGVRPLMGGTVKVGDRPIIPSVRRLRAEGVAQLASDRAGLLPGFSIAENLVAKASYDRGAFFTRWRVRHAEVARHAQEVVGRFGIDPPDPERDAALLSGGNAQKLAVARELAEARRALIAFHPTRGLDVGAARFVREELRAARARGLAILVVSADLDELEALSDRILVLASGTFHPVDEGASREMIGRLMIGAEAR